MRSLYSINTVSCTHSIKKKYIIACNAVPLQVRKEGENISKYAHMAVFVHNIRRGEYVKQNTYNDKLLNMR